MMCCYNTLVCRLLFTATQPPREAGGGVLGNLKCAARVGVGLGTSMFGKASCYTSISMSGDASKDAAARDAATPDVRTTLDDVVALDHEPAVTRTRLADDGRPCTALDWLVASYRCTTTVVMPCRSLAVDVTAGLPTNAVFVAGSGVGERLARPPDWRLDHDLRAAGGVGDSMGPPDGGPPRVWRTTPRCLGDAGFTYGLCARGRFHPPPFLG